MPRPALLAIVALGVLAGCSLGSSPEPTKSSSYVAIGDSYVSGPGITDQSLESQDCMRSDHNYPNLLDDELGHPVFADVSCGGATTATVRGGRTTSAGVTIPPQLDALSSHTSIVTVGIGGNDAGVSANLFASCYNPTTASDAACTNLSSTYLPSVLPATRASVTSILKEVHKRAPKARVMLVGYLRVAPESGSCATLPLTEANRATGEGVEVKLNETLREAAADAHTQFVDVRGISLGHDVCSGADAWVNGLSYPPGDGYPLHPNGAGMQHVAEQVRKALGRS